MKKESISEEEMSELIDSIHSLFRKGGYDIPRSKVVNFVEVMYFGLDYITKGEGLNENKRVKFITSEDIK